MIGPLALTPGGALIGALTKKPAKSKAPVRAPTKTPNKGLIVNKALGIEIYFQYNPEKLTDTTLDGWQETIVQGTSAPLLSFQGRSSHTKNFKILLDAHASPHPDGHVGHDLDKLEMLTVPYDESGKPILIPPRHIESASSKANISNKVVGVAPLVKIVYGGRVQKGVIKNLTITEELHGTTPESQGNLFPTRAHATFDFYIIDDSRMLVYLKALKP